MRVPSKILMMFISITALLNAEGEKSNMLSKTNGEPGYTKFNINNVSTFIYNNGESDQSPNGNSGFVYPKGSNKAMFFKTGFIWGGIINSQIRVGGSDYNSGLLPGKILENGTAENPNLPNVRIYKVRPDYLITNFLEEVEYIYAYSYPHGRLVTTLINEEEIRRNYERDWKEWPARDGAPFNDIDGDGIYNPAIDIPGVPGADQTIWFVANDLNEEQTFYYHGSPPIGIEMQATIWGYKNESPLKDIMFRKYIVINKSGKTIEGMYFSMWSDSEIGDATNDLVGCDTLLNMTFDYNGYDFDATYGQFIPACGFILLQGPVVASNFSDEALFLGRKVKGKKNIGMSSFNYVFKCCSPEYGSPEYADYKGTIGMYNYLQGLTRTGNPIPIPEEFGGGFTKFPFSGDPIAKTGFIGGVTSIPQDHRMGLGSGPFTMAPGDTQEVVYAQIAAGAEEETPRLQSLQLLKKYATFVKDNYSVNGIAKFSNTKPELKASYFDKRILLDWGNSDSLRLRLESALENSYDFEGYNIYQLPSLDAPKESYKRIATFDKINGVGKIIENRINISTKEFETKVLQFGQDYGIQRYLNIERDYFSGLPLNNGTPYYYAVSSYYYNDSVSEYYKTYENFSNPIKIIPQNPNPGIRYESENGDRLEVTHSRGASEADVDIMVVNPAEVNGHEYKISFRKNNENKITWELDDITENITILSNQGNITGTDEYIIADGIRIIINENESNPITENDLYRFTTPKVIYNEELAKTDIEKINVFPNPYYGYNPMETQKLGNFVMINHLPEKAVIRVFNLAGQLVRTLHKDSPDQFYLWDLQNEHRLLVGSGLYILHIEMPDLGKVKLLKLAVILGTEVPDFY